MSSQYETLHTLYSSAGQSHLFNFYPSLSPSEQQSFLKQLSEIDVERVNKIYETAIKEEKAAANGNGKDEIRPLPASACASIVPTNTATTITTSDSEVKWRRLGLEAIAKKQVAVLLMAGGQGTRLGSPDPKGMYDIGLPSGKSLFQIQAEKIRGLEKLAKGCRKEQEGEEEGGRIPWYVMTSGPTRKATEEFFTSKGYFGMKKEDVIFFDQGVLPALSDDGKIMLSSTSSIAVAPDGNGGLYSAIRQPLSSSNSTTVLSDMRSRGIKYIHAYCVDNCLVKVADPVFIGYCIERGAECGAKVVRKTAPHEKVGVLAAKGKGFTVVEYSEIGTEKAEQMDKETGELAYRAANIANHFYTLDFLEKIQTIEESMAFHIARKKIPTVDLSTGDTIKPTDTNGMKLELFVFDVFPFTSNLGVLEVERKEEFSPLKNAPGSGSDCPETSRRDLLAQQRRWIIDAGGKIEEGLEVEVGALVSYGGEGLESLKGKKLVRGGVVESLEDFEKLFAE